MNNDSVECPLCMEPMDFDDVDFYPCPCRYQICRFCWYKIINEENGLCPACRKPYNSEHPASYKPRTEEEIKNKLKHSKKICPKKNKTNQDIKEYLAEYRVLQKNLIFVVGLPMRMADEIELLKGPEYFGKCGKVYKIVINQNQTFPGPQGTSCLSAYVTYHRNDDALRTLIDLKKLEIDGRAVKLSLGTTKYCSQFLRNRKCTKQDCMYLHDMGDQAASFTKEDMANGKHTEYENQLIQEFIESQRSLSSAVAISSAVSSASSDCVSQQTTTVVPAQRKTSATSHSSLSLSANSAAFVTANNSISNVPSLSSSLSTINNNNINKQSSRTVFGGAHMTPIGTDPVDASTKIYSVTVVDNNSCNSVGGNTNAISSNSCLSKVVSISKTDFPLLSSQMSKETITATKPSQESSETSLANTPVSKELIMCGVGGGSNSPLSLSCSDSQFLYSSSISAEANAATTSPSLLESFYHLNSQNAAVATVLQHHNQHHHQQHQYDHQTINQQVNNNGVPSPFSQQFSFRNNDNIDFSRSCFRSSADKQQQKDTADIDFDPINISRQGLAELIANENRLKISQGQYKLVPQSDGLFGSPSASAVASSGVSRPVMRANSNHDYLVQSGSSSDYCYNNSGSSGSGPGRIPPSFIQEKQPSSNVSERDRLAQQMVSMNLLGYPSPPPGFELTGAGHGDTSPADIVNLMMGTNGVDLFSRYQSSGGQHSSAGGADLQMGGINHGGAGSHYGGSQYQINYNCGSQVPTANTYQTDYNYPNGGVLGPYNSAADLVSNSQQQQAFHHGGSTSHSWKNVHSYCDGQTPDMVAPAGVIRPSAVYHRSQSMNDNSGMRSTSEWGNGYSSYSSTTDSAHMNTFQDATFNSNFMPMRSPTVQQQCVSVTDSQLFSRHQNNNNIINNNNSHSVNH